MKIRLGIICAILAAASIAGTTGAAHAGQDCVTYSVTAPVLGTRTGTRCSPNLPALLSQPFTDGQCGGLPPADTTFCVTVTVYTP